ncbi:MAG: type II secretion system F family protein [Phycisphaerae bacterium]
MDTLVSEFGIYVLPLIGCMLLAFGGFQLVADLRKTDQKKVVDRLTERGGMLKKLPGSIVRRTNQPQTYMSVVLSKFKLVSWFQRALDQANIDWSASAALMNIAGLSLFAGIGAYLLGMGITVAACVAGFGLMAPLLVVNMKRKRRLNRMMNQLPDVFELMSQALRAGHSLANSMHLVGEQLPDPAGTEFAIAFHEQNLGITVEDALKHMAERLDLMDVRFFVTAVLIQRTTGGDLASVLDNISYVIRDRIKLFGQVQALTAEGRLSGWVLFALPFIVFGFMQVVNPEYGRVLLENPIGQYCLIAAVVAQLLGLALIQKIVNIKV